jgi:hypothetical protein
MLKSTTHHYQRSVSGGLHLKPLILLLLPSSFFLLPSSFFLLFSSFFLLPSSFFLLPSSFFLLPSSFFLLPSSFFLLLYHYRLPIPKKIAALFWDSYRQENIKFCSFIT